MRVSGSELWRGLARFAVMFILLLTTMPSNVLLADEATEVPATEGASVDDTPDVTLPPVEMPTETIAPPTDVPTDPPIILPTDPPATLVLTIEPPTATEAVPTDPPSATPTPTVEPSPTSSPTAAERQAAVMVQAAASGGSGLTVDGQDGTVLVQPGSTQTFAVGDLLDMAGLGPDYINSTNPDPDFYGFNGWWTENEFLVYAGRGCQGQFIDDLYTGEMQPESATATATYSGATSTYSVRAQQWLQVWWLEKKIDIVDQVDEVIVFPYDSRSSCINVEMSNDVASLMANGMTGSVSVDQGNPIALITNAPSGDGWTQSIFEGTGGCGGSVPSLVSGGPGSLVGTTLTRDPGTYWFGLRSTNGSETRYGNCVQVTVQDVPASLRVDGSSGGIQFLTSQTVSLYVDGVAPGSSLVGLAYLDSATCSGQSVVLSTGTADSAGTLETTAPLYFTHRVSVKFNSVSPDQHTLESTNCVDLYPLATSIDLKVNDGSGSVLVDGGEIHLVATGLPEGSVAYAALGCDGPFEPDDFGQTIGDDGTFEAYLSDDLPDEFYVRVVLGPDFTITSNCVHVRLVDYLIDPQIAIDGSQAPAPVVSGQHFSLTGITFPPDAAVTIRAYPGANDCSGTSAVSGAQSDNEGNFDLDRLAGEAGAISFQAEAGGTVSNCVPLQITTAPIIPTVTPTVTPTVVVPTGPIILRANGQTDPQTLAGGTKANFTAENLGTGETYHLDWYQSGDCSGTAQSLGNGVAGASQVGSLTRYVASTVSVRLTAGERTSNCVQVSWLAAPATATATITPTSPVVTATATFPGPDVTATISPTEPGVTMTVTVAPTDPTTTSTPTATGPVVTATGTTIDPAPTVTNVPTGTSVAGVTPTPTKGAVTGLPVTGGAPSHGSGMPLAIMSAVIAAFILAMVTLVFRRGVRR